MNLPTLLTDFSVRAKRFSSSLIHQFAKALCSHLASYWASPYSVSKWPQLKIQIENTLNRFSDALSSYECPSLPSHPLSSGSAKRAPKTPCSLRFLKPVTQSELVYHCIDDLVQELHVSLSFACSSVWGYHVNGYTHICHGDVVGTIIDEAMGMLSTLNKNLTASPSRSTTFTAYLNVTYLKPVATP